MKKIVSFLCLVGIFIAISFNLSAQETGLTFDSDVKYTLKEKFDAAPCTIEAYILVPTNLSGRAGVVFGNYDANSGKNFNFEIHENGKPRLYYSNSSGKDVDVMFNTSVKTGSWVHVAVVYDSNAGMVYCYVDGVKAGESNKCDEYSNNIINSYFVLGGDNRSGNAQYFKGQIASVSVYSDAKTEEEINDTINNGVSFEDDNLLAHYEVSYNDCGKNIKDLSKNHNDINCSATWFTKEENNSDYAYSFAVVGDTQVLCQKYPAAMHGIYDWILDNKDEKKIAHVFGLGDITETWVKTNMNEWDLAKACISKLDGQIPYSLVRGNHDETINFNNTFYYDEYVNQFEGFYEDYDLTCSYKLFSIADTDYLFITLDYGASDDMLEWAGEIINSYPERRVIITTHCYMFRDGTTLGAKDVCPPSDSSDVDTSPSRNYNNGDDMWNEFISKYGNIALVMSGHDPCENVVVRQSIGIHGNVVTQMLIDPQGMDANMGPTGMVCMLYFSEDGKSIDVEFYSTVHNKYFKTSNQYKIDISGASDKAHDYELLYDNTHHWYECGCEAFTEPVPHSFSGEGEFLTCECGAICRNTNYVKPSKSGCNGSAYISIIGFVVMLFGVFILRRKENKL